ncbi:MULTISPECIES: hypothetical protein [unclassified Clostridioides]|uniref:hypothetical protein n=1 Tax=unclassified Clostridioides TaxID=2635829 RepID=UPI001D0C027E|nr:hypothetical protein [Clostridioides sp. ES-S-0001-03]MCC0706128.1 hypothetical protein [Clostridioides sp. ES-S-0190-01]
MARRPKIKITLMDKKEKGACHYRHKIGDLFELSIYFLFKRGIAYFLVRLPFIYFNCRKDYQKSYS